MKPKAPFRYWGAKVRMAPWILDYLPEHNHYVEACAGSAALMAIKEPVDLETLNDTYEEITNFWKVLRNPETCAELIDKVAFTPYSLQEFQNALTVHPTTPTEQAWMFLIRMQMAVVPGKTGWSYCKTGATGKKANKPGRWANMPELLQVTAQRFQKVQITNWDILDLINRLDAPGVLIFVDPPYLEETRPNSTGTKSAYTEDEFPHRDFIEAAIHAQHASFAITHYPHPLYDETIPIVADYSSYRNIPNGDQQRQNDTTIERLYILDRTG